MPKSLDKVMDKSNPSGDHVVPGVSLRNGPVDDMDIDIPQANGVHTNGTGSGKRKSRSSAGDGKTYKEASTEEGEDDEDKPLVCRSPVSHPHGCYTTMLQH